MFLPIADLPALPALVAAGFRFGERGTHSSRTLMLSELSTLLEATPSRTRRADYSVAITSENILSKQTASTRGLTDQRLGELYGLDPKIPIFRALRRTWPVDPDGRPRLAMLAALARDPLLRATAASVLRLFPGAELVRSELIGQLRSATGDRLNEATLDKVARNAASSWNQSGHLVGRVRKRRVPVRASPGSLAMALWMGSLEGMGGEALLRCRWVGVLDQQGPELVPTVLRAKQMGLLDARIGGGLVEIDPSGLPDPGQEVRE